ncbi:MAG: 4'-phosphopantetheinyl transferase superfamily protein [Acidobacteria bacterium]|nr:MAG: 4'-phosphopantetheinyl transferase superfamily protein [Acidobacteriota bacterium]
MTSEVDFVPFAGGRGELPPLEPTTVHLWSFPLDPPPALVAACARLLSEDEQARAGRFHFPRHRRRFTVGRGVLRALLAAYAGADPQALRFAYGEKGKPSLDRRSGAPEFNLSNSHEQALIGVARSVPLGVDLEHLRPMPDAAAIAERFFSAAERQALARVSAAEKARAFFHAWTRKEAYVKAVGDGLSLPLASFDVSLRPGEPCRFLALGGDPDAARRWSLHHLEPAPGYVGALAFEARGFRLRGFALDPTALLAA